MHIPFLSRRDATVGLTRELVTALQDGGRRCVVTTRSGQGEPHSRKMRVSNYSMNGKPTLLFLIPKDCDVARDLSLDPNVVLSIYDSRSGRLIHLEGVAQLFDGKHDPAYLHPSVRKPWLHVVPGELDFCLLRVELQQIDGHVAETQPPMDVDLAPPPPPPPRGAAAFLRGWLS